jgi:acetylornithine deacetylase/succinyl-diaminopimelate desuccinylase-like protein
MANWQTYLSEHQAQYLEELSEFLHIPSISSLPDHAEDVRKAADWVVERLKKADIDNIQVLETGGHPVVFGEKIQSPDKPTVMIYGHFDVQPVDPLDLWTVPPFEPRVKDERIYARGATDNKGNMLIPILAAEAYLKTGGTLPVNLKFFFEGQEEIGSPQLGEMIPKYKDLLACDLIISADGGQWGEDQPSLTVGTRGLCAIQIDVQAADQDTHSGQWGGTFLNPIHALTRIIDSMRSPEGKILVDGFFDTVRPLTDTDRAQIAEIPYDEEEYKSKLGVAGLYGEPGFTTYERVWTRPTLDVNGIWGGFQGEGVKTVIPSKAHAKISCRLVPGQDPVKIRELLIKHVEKHAPSCVDVSAYPIAGKADPYQIPPDHPGNQAVFSVLSTIYGKKPYYGRMGGTIPVLSEFFKNLQAHTVGFAFGLNDECVHAPNEFFRLSSFEKGQKAYGLLLEELSRHDIRK